MAVGRLILVLVFFISLSEFTSSSWTGWGGSHLNNRYVSSSPISSRNIDTIRLHCQLSYPIGVSAPPTISDTTAYFSTWNGSLVALDYSTCKVQWQINVTSIVASFAPIPSSLSPLLRPVSRVSPQIEPSMQTIFFATQAHALLVAADLTTGTILATMQVSPHPLAVITGSPTLYNSVLVASTASQEELAPRYVPGYTCCSFAGNAVAVRFARENGFEVLWNVSFIDPALTANQTPTNRWSGVGIWGGQPTIDTARQRVIFGTGNVYTVPTAYENYTDSTSFPAGIWAESVLALDIATGMPAWIRRLSPLDAWTVACGNPRDGMPRNESVCPATPGPDADFAMAPAFVTARSLTRAGTGKMNTPGGADVLTIGQKNGNLYALKADDGEVLWAKSVTPGSSHGGLMWGVAADEEKVYFTGVNWYGDAWTLEPSGESTSGSAWGAASLRTGEVVWERSGVPVNNTAQVMPTVVNDVVLTGWTGPMGETSTSSGPGGFLALDKNTGTVLVNQTMPGPFYGGVAVKDNYVFFGNGYHGLENMTGGLFIYKIDG